MVMAISDERKERVLSKKRNGKLGTSAGKPLRGSDG